MKTNHGGKRNGAGRPKSPVPLITKTFLIAASQESEYIEFHEAMKEKRKV